MSKYIPFTEEQKEQVTHVDLERYLPKRGEILIASGRDKRLASDHSITIRGCEWYDHAAGKGGRAVSFIQNHYGVSYADAVSMLLKDANAAPMLQVSKTIHEKAFELPKPNNNMRRVFAYLLKERCLMRFIVECFAREHLLYEDAQHHNAVFVGIDRDGLPRHAHMRSTSGKAFRINVEGSEQQHSFHYTGNDGCLYVFEAPIDLLSYISLHPDRWQEHSYVACCGTSIQPVIERVEGEDIQTVYLCLDNDHAGGTAAIRMERKLNEMGIHAIRLVPKRKDWNDDLCVMHQGEKV